MELATLAEFTYVPEWMGNRKRPVEDRGSVVLIPLSGMDSLLDYSEEELKEWATERLEPLGNMDAYIEARVKSLHIEAIRMLRVVDEHSKDWKGWKLHGETVTDGMRICLRAMPPKQVASADETGRGQSLFVEIQQALSDASVMTEEELGNWIASFDGTAQTTESDAQRVSEDASQSSVSTPTEETVESR